MWSFYLLLVRVYCQGTSSTTVFYNCQISMAINSYCNKGFIHMLHVQDSKAQKPNKRIVFDNSDTEDEQKDENEDEIQTKDKVQVRPFYLPRTTV